jgi:hypothetical protein
MNRDALLATVIGFGVGLLITGILLVGPNLKGLLPNISWPNFLGQGASKNEGQAAPDVTFTIDSPLPDAIETDSELLVSGNGSPDSTIVLMGPLDEAVVKASSEGKWAGQVKLTEGANEIAATMYKKGEPTNLTVMVYYTPEEF